MNKKKNTLKYRCWIYESMLGHILIKLNEALLNNLLLSKKIDNYDQYLESIGKTEDKKLWDEKKNE